MKLLDRRNWLVELRRGMGITQERAAELSGVERSTYTKAENGSTVSIKTAKKIANAFKIEWTLFFDNQCDKKGQKLA